MFLDLAGNCEQIFEVLHETGIGEQREMLHDREHELSPRPPSILCICKEELLAH